MDRRFIDTFISENNQYPLKPDDSDLWKSIKQAFGCTDEEAMAFGRFHCNSLSFYTLCKASGYIEFWYETWCKLLLDNGLMTKKGYIGGSGKTKVDVAKLFGFEDKFSDMKFFESYDDCMAGRGMDETKGYNIKVFANSGEGDHFMAGYILEGKLYLSDSSGRGIRVQASKVIPRAKFQWCMEV